MAKPPPLNLKKIHDRHISTRYEVGLWKRPRSSRAFLHADWPSKYIWVVNQHAFSMPAGHLALANKAYMSIRPDGVVIDRSVGQYCNSRLLHDTHDTRS